MGTTEITRNIFGESKKGGTHTDFKDVLFSMLSSADEDKALTTTMCLASSRDLDAKLRQVCVKRECSENDPNVHILDFHPDLGEESWGCYAKIGGNDRRYAVLKQPQKSYGSWQVWRSI